MASYKVWITSPLNEKASGIFIANLMRNELQVEPLSKDPIFKEQNVSITQLKISSVTHPNSDDAIWLRDRIKEILSTTKFAYFSLIIVSTSGKSAWCASDPGVRINTTKDANTILKENLVRAGITKATNATTTLAGGPVAIKDAVAASSDKIESVENDAVVVTSPDKIEPIKINEDFLNIISKVLDKSLSMSDVFFENNKLERKEALNYLLGLKN